MTFIWIVTLAWPTIVMGAADVPWNVQGVVLLRALAYDRNLEERVDDVINVGILYNPGDEDSVRARREMLAVFEKMSSKRLRGKQLAGVALPVTDGASIAEEFEARGLDAVYLTPSLDAFVPEIKRAARAQDISTLSSSLAYAKDGVSLSVVMHSGKPKLIVNLAAARSEGMDLNSSIARVAIMIE